MRRFTASLLFALALACTPYIRAQEPARNPQENTRTEEPGEPAIGWQIANFVILAAFLGYLISKNAGKFFQARSEQIHRSLVEADNEKQAADKRLAEMERRIAHLSDEIEQLRKTMRHEMEVEGERIRLETERHIRRIQEQAEQEIESMIKVARRDLTLYAADNALRFAEEQLQGRITSDVENNLVTSFISDLRSKTGGNVYN